MGYHTDFNGSFQLDRSLEPVHHEYLSKFAEVRHMKRNPHKAANLPDPVREAAGLPLGNYAEYFVGGLGYAGQDGDASVLDNNCQPPSQPGLWCQWVPSESGDYIQWDGGEKFYNYVEWIKYLVKHFLQPWGYKLNGEVVWQGEEIGDVGKIVIVDNVVSEKQPRWDDV